MKAAQVIAHLFLPRASNNHRAKMLHLPSLLIVILAVVVVQMGLNFMDSRGSGVLGYAAQIPAEEVIRLTNIKRAEAGVPPLTLNPSLSQAAASKGAHMLANDYWAHVAPDGTQPWKFFSDVSYKYRFAGENLARDFSSASAAVDGWMASPTHRDNLLSPKYKDIGIGVVEGDLAGSDTTLIVQLFGTKAGEAAPAATVAEQPRAVAQIIPTPPPAATQAPSVTLAQANEPKVLISPFTTTKGVSLLVIGVLLGVFIIDLIVVSKRRIQRISGRSWAHLSFFGMLLIIVLIMRAGKII